MATTGPRLTDGWVYVLSNPAWPGYVKIGSSLEMNGRLSGYQTGSPFRDYALEALFKTTDRRAFERRVHAALQAVRVGRTEWFRMHPQDAKNIIDKLKKEMP